MYYMYYLEKVHYCLYVFDAQSMYFVWIIQYSLICSSLNYHQFTELSLDFLYAHKRAFFVLIIIHVMLPECLLL